VIQIYSRLQTSYSAPTTSGAKNINKIYIDGGDDVARGVKVDDATREKIIAVYNAGESMSTISRMFKVGKSTVSGIIKKYETEKPDEVEHIRTEKKIEYVNDTKEVLKELLGVFKRRVRQISENEDALAIIIDSISDSDLTPKSKTNLINKMQNIMCPKLTELTTAFGTMYDKLERMQLDDPEENGGGVVEIAETEPLKHPEESFDE
jgi:hypothetical protein